MAAALACSSSSSSNDGTTPNDAASDVAVDVLPSNDGGGADADAGSVLDHALASLQSDLVAVNADLVSIPTNERTEGYFAGIAVVQAETEGVVTEGAALGDANPSADPLLPTNADIDTLAAIVLFDDATNAQSDLQTLLDQMTGATAEKKSLRDAIDAMHSHMEAAIAALRAAFGSRSLPSTAATPASTFAPSLALPLAPAGDADASAPPNEAFAPLHVFGTGVLDATISCPHNQAGPALTVTATLFDAVSSTSLATATTDAGGQATLTTTFTADGAHEVLLRLEKVGAPSTTCTASLSYPTASFTTPRALSSDRVTALSTSISGQSKLESAYATKVAIYLSGNTVSAEDRITLGWLNRVASRYGTIGALASEATVDQEIADELKAEEAIENASISTLDLATVLSTESALFDALADTMAQMASTNQDIVGQLK